MKKTIKKLMGIVSIGTILIGNLMGCGSTTNVTGTNNKELNIICWSEYLPQEIIDEFEEKYDVKVNMINYTSPDEMLAKVQSSADGTYDMIIGPGNTIPALKNQNCIEKIEVDKIENYKNINAIYMSTINDPDNEYSIPYMCASAIIAVNTDVIKDKITGYEDLLNPKYKDTMVVIEDSRAVTGMALMARGYNINDCSDEALNAASEYLSELKPNIHAFNGDSPKTLLLNGECSLGIVYGAEGALAMEENPAIKGIYPKEGVYFGADVMMKTKGAKNSETADLFINYILDPQVSTEISAIFPYINPNEAAKDYLPEEYLNNDLKNIPSEQVENSQTLKDLGDDSSKIVNLWTKFKG